MTFRPGSLSCTSLHYSSALRYVLAPEPEPHRTGPKGGPAAHECVMATKWPPCCPLFESPRTAPLSMGLKTKWDDLLTAEWEDGLWVKVRGCFVVVVLPN